MNFQANLPECLLFSAPRTLWQICPKVLLDRETARQACGKFSTSFPVRNGSHICYTLLLRFHLNIGAISPRSKAS